MWDFTFKKPALNSEHFDTKYKILAYYVLYAV